MSDGVIAKYRETHHRIAQMFAAGMSPSMIRRRTGIGMRRLNILWNDPTFQELIKTYDPVEEEKLAVTREIMEESFHDSVATGARIVNDYLHAVEDGEEERRMPTVIKALEFVADRSGYGKSSTIKHEHDFASALDRAIERSGKTLELKAEETRPQALLPQPGAAEVSCEPAAAPTKPAKVKRPPTFTGVLRRLG